MKNPVQIPLVDSIGRFLQLTLFCASILVIGTPAGAVPSEQNAVSHLQHSPVSIVRNPHLKGVEQSAKHVQQILKGEKSLVHKTWYRRWDYRRWMVLHRGLGEIRGVVHTAGGEPMTSAKMVLRRANGATIVRVWMRHITYTDAGGNFTMLGVHSGKYRVVAFVNGKKKGRAQAVVHPGMMASVAVKA